MKAIVIAGGSTAGLAAARTLRAEGYRGQISVIEPEAHHPYDRTALSKDLLRGRVSATDIALLDDGRLTALGVDWRRGRCAVELDPEARRVGLDDGSALSYDGLVLATGSTPRTLVLGERAPAGVQVLRGLDDAQALQSALGQRGDVLLVGGGFVGLEVAAAALESGARVTVVERDAAPLARVLGAAVGSAIAGRHIARGMTCITGAQLQAWTGHPTLTGARLEDASTVTAAVAVVGIGVVPNTDWLAASGVGDAAGVCTDATLATTAPGVVAAGDIVRWPHPFAGREVRAEHFEHAQLSGSHAARRLLHGPSVGAYAPIPFVWSHQGEHTIHLAGFPSGAADVDLLEGDLADGPFAVGYREDGRLTAVLTLDSPRTFRRLRRELSSQGVAA